MSKFKIEVEIVFVKAERVDDMGSVFDFVVLHLVEVSTGKVLKKIEADFEAKGFDKLGRNIKSFIANTEKEYKFMECK